MIKHTRKYCLKGVNQKIDLGFLEYSFKYGITEPL